MKSDFEWTQIEAVAPNNVWPSQEGIPVGEEWEVYWATLGTGGVVTLSKDEKSMRVGNSFGTAGPELYTAPLQGAMMFSLPAGDTYIELSISPRGFRMTGEEKLTSNVPLIIRARRIR